jgi:hypothetical protein
MNTAWRKFPATIPAHGTIRLLIPLHHPSFCAQVPLAAESVEVVRESATDVNDEMLAEGFGHADSFAFGQVHRDVYVQYGFELVEVPPGEPEHRSAFIRREVAP